MASFNSRWSEIEKEFEAAYQTAIEKKEPEEIVLANKVRILGVLEKYIDLRNKTMESALKLLAEKSDSYTEKSQSERWTREIRSSGQTGFKMISDLDDNEESILNVTLLKIATQEGHFFSQLASMPLAKVQGFLLEKSKKLEEEKKKLKGKWAALTGSANSTNKSAKQAGEKMLKAFDNALKEVGKEKRRAAEAVAAAWKAFVIVASAADGGKPDIPDVVDALVSRLDTMVSTAEDVAHLYRNAYKSNETTLVVLGTTRDLVRKFLEETDLEVCLDRTGEARKESETIARSTLTQGQKDDASTFASEGGKAIQAAMDKYEKSFNDFIKEFRDIFVGPIGNKELDQLLAGQFWEVTENNIKRLNFESALKKYYDEAKNMWDIPLDGLDSTLQAAFKDAFKQELREFDDALEKAIKTYVRAFRDIFIDYPVNKLEEIASRSRGYSP